MADPKTTFAREHEALPAPWEPVADNLLGSPCSLRSRRHGIRVGRVQEVDAMLVRLVHDGERGGFIALVAEGHCAETDFGDFQASVAHAVDVHDDFSPGCRRSLLSPIQDTRMSSTSSQMILEQITS